MNPFIFKGKLKDNLYTNTDCNYNDILVNTGTIIKGQWENQICTGIIDNEFDWEYYLQVNPDLRQNEINTRDKALRHWEDFGKSEGRKCSDVKIIATSNHFLITKWGINYNEQYKIFDNIERNFYQNIDENSNINYELENIDCFNCLNPFMFSNSGHDLSTLLDNINYINKNNIKNIIIMNGYKDTNNYKLCSHLLNKNVTIHELLPETIYKFKKIIIIDQMIAHINLHTYLIEDLKNIIIEKYSHLYTDYKDKKLILIKSNRNKNVLLEDSRVNCEDLLLKLEELNYVNIIPEETDVNLLVLMLMYANKIIFSVGSVLYTNKIFFNPNAKLFHIYKDNYDNSCTDNLKIYKDMSYAKNTVEKLITIIED